MIDQIFEMIMKEARLRPGKDLVSNIYTVFMEVSERVNKAMEELREQERRNQADEKQKGNYERIS